MTERTITVDGATWTVSITGRVTVYDRDEFPLVFERRGGDRSRDRRLARVSPLGGKSRAVALSELSDAELVLFLRQSQPAWTSPELGYARP